MWVILITHIIRLEDIMSDYKVDLMGTSSRGYVVELVLSGTLSLEDLDNIFVEIQRHARNVAPPVKALYPSLTLETLTLLNDIQLTENTDRFFNSDNVIIQNLNLPKSKMDMTNKNNLSIIPLIQNTRKEITFQVIE